MGSGARGRKKDSVPRSAIPPLMPRLSSAGLGATAPEACPCIGCVFLGLAHATSSSMFALARASAQVFPNSEWSFSFPMRLLGWAHLSVDLQAPLTIIPLDARQILP